MYRRLISKAIALVVVVLTFLALGIGPASAASWPVVYAHGYAGYFQSSPYSDSFEGVEMTFTIPSNADQHCAPSKGMPTWVGMYGYDNNGNMNEYPFIQNGISINDGGTTSGWYEIFDANGNTVTTGVSFSADPGDSITLREVWGYGHENVWFVWSNHSTGQYTVVKRYLPGYYPAGGHALIQYQAEDNYSATHFEGNYWRIPWFGRIHVTSAEGEQTTSTTPADGAGVPYRQGVVPLDDTTVNTQWDMWNYDEKLVRVYPTVPQNGAFDFVQSYCY
jgi:hypothetical protein